MVWKPNVFLSSKKRVMGIYKAFFGGNNLEWADFFVTETGFKKPL